MKFVLLFSLGLCLFGMAQVSAQDSLLTRTRDIAADDPSVVKARAEYDPLAPARAAFYSAVLPGLGQAYNRSYWKIPIVYAGLGISIYSFIENNKKFHSYRDAYKRRLAGYNDDEYQGQFSDDGLVEAQKRFRKNKEISIFATVIIYALNIVDANVDAHLRQFNVSKDLSLKPDYNMDHITGYSNYGLTLNFNF